MIRLSTLAPDAVAAEVAGWVQSQIFRLGLALGVTDPSSISHVGDVVHATRVLTHYAVTGEPPGDAPISGYLQSVVEALYTAAHPDVYTRVHGDWQDETADPEHAIDAVIRAALARDRISSGERVPLHWVSVLAGTPLQTLRQYATPSRGELTTLRDGTITAHEASRWLSGRGVTGYLKPSS